MSRKLADLSMEERESCVGMWADIDLSPDPNFPGVWIVTDIVDTNKVQLINPTTGDNARVGNYRVALLPDLPRAWGKDGQPPQGVWEEGLCSSGGRPDGSFATIVESDGKTDYAPDSLPTGDVRRWVSEWEPVKEEA